jgi:cyclopropane fatty-acyl-phospholipid synthase-like methyltransferase
LKLADVQKFDAVYDLGCGDGRIVIAAAKEYGVHGVGIDINPERIQEAEANAKKAGVEKLVRF